MLLDWCEVWFFFFKQKTAYEMRISDWSSDVCSSDLERRGNTILLALPAPLPPIGMATTGHAEVRTTPPHPTLTHGPNLAQQGYAHLRMGDRKSGARLLAAEDAMAPHAPRSGQWPAERRNTGKAHSSNHNTNYYCVSRLP